MKRNKITYTLLIPLVLMIALKTAKAQDSELNQVGTSMANFLKVGVGARATAMGDAYVALSNDASALYWNPGGIGSLVDKEILFQVTDWLQDSKFYFLGVVFPVQGVGVIGASIYSFSSGDIEETTIYEPDGTGRSYTASDISIGLTYSRQITDRFSAGLTVKYISEQLDRETASTVAIDLGSVFVTNILNDLRIGFSLSNLGGRMQLSGTGLNFQYNEEPSTKYSAAQLLTEQWDIPLLFRFGLATDVLKHDLYKLTVSTEIMDSRDFIHRISAGAELSVKDMFFIRSGYRQNYDETKLTFGGGVNFPIPPGIDLSVDYAYGDFGVFDTTQRFSIIFKF